MKNLMPQADMQEQFLKHHYPKNASWEFEREAGKGGEGIFAPEAPRPGAVGSVLCGMGRRVALPLV